jgi:hypothetical protein
LFQHFPESPMVGMRDLDFERIDAALQDFSQIIFFF